MNSTFYYSLVGFILPIDYVYHQFFYLSLSLTIILIVTLSRSQLEILFLYFLLALGTFIILCSTNWFTIYLGLECQSFSLFVLIAKRRYSLKAVESALKYFMMTGITSAIFLLGIVMLWSDIQSLDIANTFCSFSWFSNLGICFILIALSFKLGLVPYHVWVLDVYEGSPWSLILWISTLPKISIFIVLIKCNFNETLLLWLGVLSILIGSIGALNQTKLKRIFGYSSIAHMGFVVVAWSMWSSIHLQAGLIYLILYFINNLGILLLFLLYPNPLRYISDLSPWGRCSHWWGWVFLIFLFSLAGIPPLAGFLGKWGVFYVLVEHQNYGALMLILLGTIISVGYYVRLAQHVYIQQWSSFYVWKSAILPPKRRGRSILLWILGYCVFLSITLLWYPNIIWTLILF